MEVSVCTLLHNFLCLSSTDMFPYKCVIYETCSCACSRTKRWVRLHFLTYEVMSMRNFKHMTPCSSQSTTGAVETKYHITTF